MWPEGFIWTRRGRYLTSVFGALSTYYSALAEATKTLRTEQEGASKGGCRRFAGGANSLVTTLEPAIDLKIGELRKAETKKLSDNQKAWGDYQRDKGALTPTDLSGMTMERATAAMQADREALNGLKKAYHKAIATADKAYCDTVDRKGTGPCDRR